VRAVPAWPLGGSAHLSFQAAASQSGQRGQPGSRARAKPGRCQRSGGEGRSPPLSCVGMCSQTAVRRRRTEAATIEAATTSVYPGQSDVVGLAGLEPAASSLSGIFAGMRSGCWSEGRPAHHRRGVDRGCPLDTGVVRPMWHASGTAGEDDCGSALAALAPARAMSPDRPGRHELRWQASARRRGRGEWRAWSRRQPQWAVRSSRGTGRCHRADSRHVPIAWRI
jgi:hypothetical protein